MKRLLLSIHDVGPRFEEEVDRLVAHVAAHVQPAALAMLVEDPPLARRLGAAGRARALARFTMERTVAAYRDLYAACGRQAGQAAKARVGD